MLQQWHSDDNRVFFPSSKGFKGDNFSTFISSRGFSLNRPTVTPLPQVDYWLPAKLVLGIKQGADPGKVWPRTALGTERCCKEIQHILQLKATQVCLHSKPAAFRWSRSESQMRLRILNTAFSSCSLSIKKQTPAPTPLPAKPYQVVPNFGFGFFFFPEGVLAWFWVLVHYELG